jgi:hypothetical protein
MFGRLKDIRRIVTGYDRFTCNFLDSFGIGTLIAKSESVFPEMAVAH